MVSSTLLRITTSSRVRTTRVENDLRTKNDSLQRTRNIDDIRKQRQSKKQDRFRTLRTSKQAKRRKAVSESLSTTGKQKMIYGVYYYEG